MIKKLVLGITSLGIVLGVSGYLMYLKYLHCISVSPNNMLGCFL